MQLNEEIIKTIYLRGHNLKNESKIDTILIRCLCAAMDGIDCISLHCSEEDEAEMKSIAEELRALNFEVYFATDINKSMFVTWGRKLAE